MYVTHAWYSIINNFSLWKLCSVWYFAIHSIDYYLIHQMISMFNIDKSEITLSYLLLRPNLFSNLTIDSSRRIHLLGKEEWCRKLQGPPMDPIYSAPGETGKRRESGWLRWTEFELAYPSQYRSRGSAFANKISMLDLPLLNFQKFFACIFPYIIRIFLLIFYS